MTLSRSAQSNQLVRRAFNEAKNAHTITSPSVEQVIQALIDQGSPANADLDAIVLSEITQVVLNANTDRKGFIFFNNSNKKTWIAFADTASNSLFTYELTPRQTLEVCGDRVYTGKISAISEMSVTGFLQITELT